MIRACALGFCLVLGLAGTAHAALSGKGLVVTGGCRSGGTIAIDPDPTLSGGIVVEGPTGTPPGAGSDGSVVVIPACADDTLRIHVPPTFPVHVEVRGDRSVHLGDLAGPISIAITGSTLSAGTLSGPVRLESVGDGDMTIAALSGPTLVSLRGSGDLAIGGATVPALTVEIEGSGDVRVGGGTIAHLGLAMRGSGDVRIAGVVGSGSVNDAGDGDVSIDRVVGDLAEVQSGSGDIHVGEHGGGTPPSITITPPSMPPMPVINIQQPHFSGRAGTANDVVGLLRTILELVLFAAASIGGVLVVRQVRRRRTVPPNAMPTRPEIVRLAERLDAIARRTGALEQAVTSDEFDLDRRFRDIGADRPT